MVYAVKDARKVSKKKIDEALLDLGFPGISAEPGFTVGGTYLLRHDQSFGAPSKPYGDRGIKSSFKDIRRLRSTAKKQKPFIEDEYHSRAKDSLECLSNF